MGAVGSSLPLLSPVADGGGQVLEHGDGGLPVDAGIGDGDALLEAAGALGRHLLVALVNVGLDHDADNARLALANLLGDRLGHQGLVAVVLVGVAWLIVRKTCSVIGDWRKLTVRAVDHHDLSLALLA